MMCVISSFREQITQALLIQVNSAAFGIDGLPVDAALNQALRQTSGKPKEQSISLAGIYYCHKYQHFISWVTTLGYFLADRVLGSTSSVRAF